MDKIVRIPKDHLIVACDSRKALLLRNRGPVAQPELEVAEHLEAEDRRAEMFDADRPGRRADGGAHAASGGPRSAMETRDVGELLAVSFAETLVDHLAGLHHRSPLTGIILVAPPSFLGLLRRELKDELGGIPISEVHKHLSDLPVAELQKALLQSLSQ